jgi:hypothetical protein
LPLDEEQRAGWEEQRGGMRSNAAGCEEQRRAMTSNAAMASNPARWRGNAEIASNAAPWGATPRDDQQRRDGEEGRTIASNAAPARS